MQHETMDRSQTAASPGMAHWVYLDGDFLAGKDARVSVYDRGFLFAHAAYEVTAVYNGKLIDFDHHMARLRSTLASIEIEFPQIDFVKTHQQMIDRNQLREGLIYVQVTAGDQGPRDYYGPDALRPTVYMFAAHKTLIGDVARDGLNAISVDDTRWARRDLKTTQLVTQTLAYRAARRAGADTAILHEDGIVTEAASANLWIADRHGTLVTRDLSSALLPGITRGRLMTLLGEQNCSIEERAFTLDELLSAQEAFTSSTGVVIAPVLSVDGQPIGTGTPGTLTRQVQAAYYSYIGADISAFDWL